MRLALASPPRAPDFLIRHVALSGPDAAGWRPEVWRGLQREAGGAPSPPGSHLQRGGWVESQEPQGAGPAG